MDAFARIAVDAEQRKVAHGLEKNRNGTKILAERAVILKGERQSNARKVIECVPGEEQPEHDLFQMRNFHQEQPRHQRQRQGKHHIAQNAQFFPTRLLRPLVGQKVQRHGRPAGVAAPAAPEQQRAEDLCHGVVDGRRLEGAEKQIVPEPLDLHIFAGDDAEVQQHIAANCQLRKMAGIAFPGDKERCSQCQTAADVTEIQQVEQVVLHKP